MHRIGGINRQITEHNAVIAFYQRLCADDLRLADLKAGPLPDNLLRDGFCRGKSKLLVEGKGFLTGRVYEHRVLRLFFCMDRYLRNGKHGFGDGTFLRVTAHFAADLYGNGYLSGVEHSRLCVCHRQSDLRYRTSVCLVHLIFQGKSL